MTRCSPPSTAALLPRRTNGCSTASSLAGSGPTKSRRPSTGSLSRRRRFSNRSPGRRCDPATMTVCSSRAATRLACASTSPRPCSRARWPSSGGWIGRSARSATAFSCWPAPATRGTGRSVIADRRTTCLPKYMERGAYYLTAWRLGRYYRTYPAYVQDEVTDALNDPRQFVRGPRTQRRGTSADDSPAFVVQDGNYLSARWPGDAYLFAERFRRLLEETSGRQAQ